MTLGIFLAIGQIVYAVEVGKAYMITLILANNGST
jgi:hypothetical protein